MSDAPADETAQERAEERLSDEASTPDGGDDLERAKARLLDVSEGVDEAVLERTVRQNPLGAVVTALIAGFITMRVPRLRRLIWHVATLGIQRRIKRAVRERFGKKQR